MTRASFAPPSRPSPPPALALARRRAALRSSSSGGVMFIVAMTIAVLAGLGAWALQSAALEVRMSGYERQNTQTHYISEYGILAGMQAAPTMMPQIIGAGATQGTCLSAPWAQVYPTNTSTVAQTCWVGYDAQYTLGQLANTTSAYAAPPTPYGPYGVPTNGPFAIDPSSTTASGSLGYSSVQGDFRVELTEAVNAAPTLKAGNSGHLYWVTLSSYGQTGLSAGTSTAQNASEGTEVLRSRVLVSFQ